MPSSRRRFEVCGGMLLLFVAACRSSVPATSEDAPSAPEPPPAATNQPDPVDPRYARACDEFLVGYCEVVGAEENAEAVGGEDLPSSRHATLHRECVELFSAMSADEDVLARFESCLGCVGNCEDADACLPDPSAPAYLHGDGCD